MLTHLLKTEFVRAPLTRFLIKVKNKLEKVEEDGCDLFWYPGANMMKFQRRKKHLPTSILSSFFPSHPSFNKKVEENVLTTTSKTQTLSSRKLNWMNELFLVLEREKESFDFKNLNKYSQLANERNHQLWNWNSRDLSICLILSEDVLAFDDWSVSKAVE